MSAAMSSAGSSAHRPRQLICFGRCLAGACVWLFTRLALAPTQMPEALPCSANSSQTRLHHTVVGNLQWRLQISVSPLGRLPKEYPPCGRLHRAPAPTEPRRQHPHSAAGHRLQSLSHPQNNARRSARRTRKWISLEARRQISTSSSDAEGETIAKCARTAAWSSRQMV